MLESTEKWMQFTAQDRKAQELQLKETLARAYLSPLYRKLWKQSGFTPGKFQGVGDLNALPFLSRKELFEATKTKPNKVSVAPVSQWFLGCENTATHEWFPYGEADLLAVAPTLARLGKMAGLQRGDIILALVDVPPKFSSFIPYIWSHAVPDCGLEFIIGSLDWYDTLGMTWINFIQKRRPTAILATAKNAEAFAQKLVSMNTSVKEALSAARVGVFYGNHTSELMGAYSSLELFDAYSPTEHMTFHSACRSHSGIHLWQDICIPEILPLGQDKAQLVCESTSGVRGELVLTTFSEALPLIRYKTGVEISVAGNGECACGCNHPRVKFSNK
jgi:phenylacetate-CoA ligase